MLSEREWGWMGGTIADALLSERDWMGGAIADAFNHDHGLVPAAQLEEVGAKLERVLAPKLQADM